VQNLTTTEGVVRTDPRQVEILKNAGFVHVTGLVVRNKFGGQWILRPANEHLRGYFGFCLGSALLVAVTEVGEWWISSADHHDVTGKALKTVCPKGRHTEINQEMSFIEGTFFVPYALLKRVYDPYCRPYASENKSSSEV